MKSQKQNRLQNQIAYKQQVTDPPGPSGESAFPSGNRVEQRLILRENSADSGLSGANPKSAKTRPDLLEVQSSKPAMAPAMAKSRLPAMVKPRKKRVKIDPRDLEHSGEFEWEETDGIEESSSVDPQDEMSRHLRSSFRKGKRATPKYLNSVRRFQYLRRRETALMMASDPIPSQAKHQQLPTRKSMKTSRDCCASDPLLCFKITDAKHLVFVSAPGFTVADTCKGMATCRCERWINICIPSVQT